jgi:hypothetical protein
MPRCSTNVPVSAGAGYRSTMPASWASSPACVRLAQPSLSRLFGVEGRQRDHRGAVGEPADTLDRGEAVDPGHAQVHEHHVGPAAPDRVDRLGAKLLAVGLPAQVAGVLSAALAAAVGMRMLASRGVPVPSLGDGAVLAAILGASGSLVGTGAERSAAHLPAAGADAVICAWAALFVLAAGASLARRDA